jgi:O-antigen ligase
MTSLAYAALWLFIFTVPCEIVLMLPGVGVLTKFTGMLALGATLFAAVVSGRIRRWHLFHVLAFLFVFCAAAELFVFHSGEKLPNKLWTYVQLFLVLFMVWEVARSSQRLSGLLTAYVFGAYVAAFGTVLLFRREAGLRRFAAGGGDANDLAMRMALAVPMAWYLGMTARQPWLRLVCRAYLVVGLLAIALTGSRGGMLTTMVALLIVPLTMTKLTPGRLATALTVLALAGGLAVAYVPDKIVQRLATTGTEVEDARIGGRFKLWVAGIHAFEQKPIFGFGTSGFKAAIAPEMGQATQVAHDSYVSVLVEQGIVGFLLYVMMLGAVFLALLRLPHLERRFALVLMATMVVAMTPLTWEDHKAVWFILAALIGFAHTPLADPGGAPPPALSRSAAAVRPRAARPLEPLIAPRTNARWDRGA